MSKTERRKLFQPIPLSSILDPTYKSPFSKLEKFQVDMDFPSKFPQPSVWQKLQSSLLNAMSNFVIMTQPVFASSTTSVTSHRSTHMSLVPWKSFKPCELLISEEFVDSMPKSASLPSTPIKSVPEKSASLYHSVRSGLQCLRYLATHPLQSEEDECKESAQTQTPTRHYYDCRKQNNNIVLPAVGFPIVGGGGALFFPLISSADCTSRNSLSAPASPTHHYQHQTWRPIVSNLFSWAMSGFLLATPLHHRHFDSLYKNYCLFSPLHAKDTEINTTMLCQQKSSGNAENLSSPCTAKTEGNIEIFIHSSSSATCHDSKSGKDLTINCRSSASPTKAMSLTNSPIKTNASMAGNNNGCIRIETNWMAVNDESSSRTNFHTVSVCSSSSALKGGTLTFSCSSVSSSPRSMMSAARAIPRRLKTESESSTDSFVEFSASVESTDSFCIVFESAGGCKDDEDNNNREIDDEDWEDDDDDDDDSDDDDDQIFNYSGTSEDIFVDGYIFETDGIDLSGSTSCDQVDLCIDRTIPNKKHKKKTVSFDEEHLENIVEFEDDLESKSSRETYWEMQARDRTRFQDRILRTGDILECILQPAHRLQVYKQRFLKADEIQLK